MYQTALSVMQACPDRNSGNQPEAADDDISVSLCQVMNGSVKSRALAQESSWAFSHAAASKRQPLWFFPFHHLCACQSLSTLTATVNVPVYNLSRPKFLSVEDAATAAFLFSFLIFMYQGHLLKMQRDTRLWWCHRFSNLFSQKLFNTPCASI